MNSKTLKAKNIMMKFLLAMTLMSFLLTKTSNAQVWSWATSMGDTTGNTALYDMYLLSDSSILVAGSFESKTLVLGNHTLENKGTIDILLAKIDSTGKYQWAASFGGTTEERATAVAGDQMGNIYVAGNFNSSTIKLGNTSLQNKGESDVFLIKINAEKETEWAWSYGNNASDEVTDIDIDAHGNVLITGFTVDFPSNQFHFFLAKIDPQKQVLWQHKVMASNYHPMTTSLITDEADNIYIAGSFSDTLRFDKNNQIISTRRGEAPYEYHEVNAFVAKYDSKGNFITATAIPAFSKINDITLFNENLFMCGEKINYGMGWGWPLMDSKIYLAKYSTQLQAVWEKSTGGEIPLQSLDVARSITTDNVGNIYLTGSYFSPEISFAGSTLTNPKNKEYYHQQTFILKYDTEGNEIWGRAIGENLCDVGYEIAATTEDAFFLAGTYESAQISLGNHLLKNTGKIQMLYVHLRPERESRRTFAYVALHGTVVTGNHQPLFNNRMVIFPNPASDHFTLKLTDHQGAEVSIHRHDGKLLRCYKLDEETKQMVIGTEDLKRGVYLVKTKMNQHALVQKLIIQ
jgi:hypothetical protein